MSRNALIIAVLAGAFCFMGGFVLANFLNRSEMNDLRGDNERLRSQVGGEEASQTLSAGEIDAKIAEAENNATNFAYQKGLGLGLYRYGAIKQDSAVIDKAIPVLTRANALKPEDYDVIVGLGNAWYDVGYLRKENPPLEKARQYYMAALAARPDDIEVRTDLGLTYYIQQPADHKSAVSEFQRSLAKNASHEKTLQFMILSLRELGKNPSDYVERLKKVNPENTVLGAIASQNQQLSTNN